MATKPKTKKNKNKYLKRVVNIYSLVVFAIISIMLITCFAIVRYNENQNSDIIENTFFLNSVDTFEQAYEDFFVLTDELKSKNELVVFSLTDEQNMELYVEGVAQLLSGYTESYNHIGSKIIVYRDDVDLAISKYGGSSLESALSGTDITSRELKVVTEYLNYSTDENFCVLTDENLFFIAQKTIGSSNAFIICYKETTSIYENNGNDNSCELFFWDNAQNVLDLRTTALPDTIASQNSFYMANVEAGEMKLSSTEDTQYRLYKSEFFDIIYCSMHETDVREEFISIIIVGMLILLALYCVIHFIIDKVSRIAFYPVTKLLEYVSHESNDEDFFDGEIVSVSAYIRKIQNKNSELKKQLEQMNIKVRAVSSFIPRNLQEELEEKVVTTDYEKTIKNIEDDEDLKEKLAQYVIDHISEDIGLRDVAEHFDLSFAYMSTLFKNKMQMNFKEYVSYQRYIHSLDIMQENPKMKIAEVAEKVGIVNLNTFIRIFKKYNDITPKQYMSMLESNQLFDDDDFDDE